MANTPRYNKIAKVLTTAVIVITAILVLQYCENRSKISSIESLNKNLITKEKEAVIYRDKLNRIVIEKQALEGDYKSLKRAFSKSLSSKDSLIKSLIEQVNKNTVSAVDFRGSISVDKSVLRDTLRDTVINNVVHRIPIVYKDSWIRLKTFESKDSARFSLSVKYEYTVLMEERNKGFLSLKRPDYYAKVINHNPYTDTTAMQMNSYVKVAGQPKNRGAWFTAGLVTPIIVKLILNSINAKK